MDYTQFVTQVQTECPCFEYKSPKELEPMIESLILLLSKSLCWDNGFEYQSRQETFEFVNNLQCLTCDRYQTYPLFYQSPNMDIVDVELVTYEGLQEVKYSIPKNEWVIRKGNLLIDTANLPRTFCLSNCEEFELNVTYNSGYKEFPPRLLPVFCSLLVSMSLSLMGYGSVKQCTTMDKPKAYQIIKTKKVGEISRTWTTDENHIEFLYEKMLTQNQLRLISELSLCNRLNLDERLWFVKS